MEVPLNDKSREGLEVPLNDKSREGLEVPLNDKSREGLKVPLNDKSREGLKVPLNESKYICPVKMYKTLKDVQVFLKDVNNCVNIQPILIGSYALKQYISLDRKIGDYDLIVDLNTAKELLKQATDAHCIVYELNINDRQIPYIKCIMTINQSDYELEIVTDIHQSGYLIHESLSSHFKKVILDVQMYNKFFYVVVPPISLLETIKTSHIFHSNNFIKHIKDLHLIRRYMYYNKIRQQKFIDKQYIYNEYEVAEPPKREPSSEYSKILELRRLETDLKKGVPGSHINLNMTNEDFLDREGILKVDRPVKHDDIHEMVKFTDVPMYTRLKSDQSKATCLKSLWDKLTYEEQLQDVMEEAMVLALERYMFPNIETDEQTAYILALIRICTNITKGWFREFAVNNFPKLCICPKPLGEMANYVRSGNIDIQQYIRDLQIRKAREEAEEKEKARIQKEQENIRRYQEFINTKRTYRRRYSDAYSC